HSFFTQCVRFLLYLLSFPTRRSSDLVGPILQSFGRVRAEVIEEGDGAALAAVEEEMQEVRMARRSPAARRNRVHEGEAEDIAIRSEEHTSELQSRVDLVCRLLLEKKK